MRTFPTAYRAASHHAQEHGRKEEFDDACNDYTDRLVEEGVLVELGGRDESERVWRLTTSDSWFIVTNESTLGPYETKTKAMSVLGVESTSRVDTGVYSVGDDDGFSLDTKFIVRYDAAEEYGIDLNINLDIKL